MASIAIEVDQQVFLPHESLDNLIQLLIKQGYNVVGPRRVDESICMQPIQSAADLPVGLRDEQDGGHYRLVEGDEGLLFEYVVGAEGPKKYFFPPRQRLFQLHIEGEQFALDAGPPQVPKLALFGIRPCELAAIAVHDRVFGTDDPNTLRCESESYYTQTREQTVLIAVNCTRPGGTCFCDSMGTGPAATAGFDLALTELRNGFVIHIGSARGKELAAALSVREPSSAELELAELKLSRARDQMGRRMDTRGVRGLLKRAVEHPQWDDVASRCLACGNCTMVCPTCFCSTVIDNNDIASDRVTRTRQWESCFTHQFSYTTAGPVRSTIRGRYRHWLRHKLSTWWDQFDSSGCVGCGRCITWCPVGIDLTAQVEAIRRRDDVESNNTSDVSNELGVPS